MGRLLSVGTALPEHSLTAAETKAYLARLLGTEPSRRFANIVDRSGNQARYSVLPLAELLRLTTVGERNECYRRHAVPLAVKAARRALSVGDIDPQRIDALVCVSSSGYLMPALDVHVANELGINPRCRRLSLTQSGCAGGVAALSLASEMLRGSAAGQALVVSVEAPSLSLQSAEPSWTDVISSTQFGDGAGAAVVSAESSLHGPEIVATHTLLAPGTIERDGIRCTSTGLRLARQRGLKQFIEAFLSRAVRGFLDQQGLPETVLSFWLVHPRSPQVLTAVRDSLGLDDQLLEPAWSVWQRYGNLVSASVFFLLEELQRTRRPAPADLGLMLAVGAGMTCEMALLRSGGWLSRGG